MAETVWTNALADGDFNNNGNWTGDTPGTGGLNTPGIFDGRTQTPPTTNLDRSAGGAFHLTVTPEYTGGLGSSGTPLTWNGTGGGLGCTLKAGGGDYYLHMVAAQNSDAIINAPGIDVSLYGEILGLYVLAGNVTIASTCTLLTDAVFNGSRSVVTIAAANTTEELPNQIRVEGADVTIARTWTDAVDAQVLILAGTLDITGLLRSETDVHVLGGLLTYEPTSDPSGEHPNVWATGGGIFDMRGSTYALSTTGRIIYGAGGHIRGSIGQGAPSSGDYNLDDPFPGT